MNKRQRLSNWILIKGNFMFFNRDIINKNERSVRIWLNTHTHTHIIPIISTRKEEIDVLDEKHHQIE